MTATITVHGGLTSQPELRYSQSGVPIASGTVASTDRYMDKQTNEWKDGKSLFLRFSAFKGLAENIAGSNLDKGSQVVVTGKLITRQYDDNTGQKRSVTELEVTDFAVSLKRATATVTKTSGGGSGSDAPWSAPSQPAQQGNVWDAANPGGDYDPGSPF